MGVSMGDILLGRANGGVLATINGGLLRRRRHDAGQARRLEAAHHGRDGALGRARVAGARARRVDAPRVTAGASGTAV